MPEACGETTLEEEKEFECPHCKKKFSKTVSITGDACIEFDLSNYAPNRQED
jgi:protein-disulfide isomerase